VLIESGSIPSAISSVKAELPDLLVAFGTEAAQFAEQNFPRSRASSRSPGRGSDLAERNAVHGHHAEISPDLQVRWIDETLPT